MAFPSSPPLDLDNNIASSPPPLPTYRSFSNKRQFSDYNESSDPLFSEESSEVELGSSSGIKRKRFLKGPWWTLAEKSKTRHGVRTFKIADSGVWMNSDDDERTTFSSSDDVQLPSVKVKALNDPRVENVIITRALEDNKERIDLSKLNLEVISNETLRPLHQLIREPTEHVFGPFTPELELYLSGNRLSSLPTELFKLTNLAVLSLRNNRLSILPSAIARLPKLQELNIAGNELRYIPWDLMSRIRGSAQSRFTVSPNDYYELGTLKDVAQARYTAARERPGQEPSAAVFLATSRLSYYNNNGSRMGEADYTPNLTIQPASKQRIPSLFEYALRRAGKEVLEHAIELLPRYTPSCVVDGLNQTILCQEVGRDRCSTCGEEMIMAKAEWVEYWSLSMTSKELIQSEVIPFLKKACTLSCAVPTTIGSVMP